MNIGETEKKATFKGSFLSMENIHVQYPIDIFKKKSAFSFVKSFMECLPEEDLATIMKMAEDRETSDDVAKFFFWVLNSQKSETIPEFLINFPARLEQSMDTFPEFSNIENIKILAEIFDRLYTSGNFPRQKIIQRSQFFTDLDIDKETFNDWLLYFDFKKYNGQREFTSKEYAEIYRAIMYVEGLDIEKLKPYHFKGIDKLTIGKIIVGDSKSNQTVYRKLQKMTDEIDDLKPDNRKLIEWVSSHRKIPFSVAHRWVTLLLDAQNNPKAINTLEVFDEYFRNK
ncbi:MAG: hypothetical protein L6264_11010 [Weeksellaceae bacterium]|nr:hypothetical protein [Bacteroidota bacterium]MCG2781465.1 hypothetical protein [Weeksellaceae bacterium]